MTDIAGFAQLSPTTLADLLGREQVMDIGVRPLWAPMPRVAGPAFTVRCPPGDNLMLHAAIHRAPRGSIVVVESGDSTTRSPAETSVPSPSGTGSRRSCSTG